MFEKLKTLISENRVRVTKFALERGKEFKNERGNTIKIDDILVNVTTLRFSENTKIVVSYFSESSEKKTVSLGAFVEILRKGNYNIV